MILRRKKHQQHQLKRKNRQRKRKRLPLRYLNDFHRIVSSYYHAIVSRDDPARKVGWENRDTQQKRFLALLRNVPLEKKSILDVGCGLGALYTFLKQQQIHVHYSGIDVSQELLAFAKRQYPEVKWYNGDIFSSSFTFSSGSFDVLYSSGLLNLRCRNNMYYLEALLSHMMFYSKRYVVFNVLSDIALNQENDIYYYYNKEKIILLLKKKGLYFSIDSSYLQNDMTVCIELE